MEIIETSIFTRLVVEYLSDEEYRDLQMELCRRPDIGKKIPSSGGIRKLRWAMEGKGKRGGYRVIYYWFNLKDQILMLYIYPKNKQDNLTVEQIKILHNIIDGK